MLHNAFPANATALPDKLATDATLATTKCATVAYLPAWAGSIGRTVADVAVLLFVMPMPAHFRPMFEDRIRQEVASELLRLDLSDSEADRIERIAWLAFDRRLARHGAYRMQGGCA